MDMAPLKINKMKNAVVIGAGISGLLVSKVLSKYFESVIVLDKDILPSQPVNRQFVPQMTQTHIFLSKGQKIIEDFFPGFGKELDNEGLPIISIGRSMGWLNSRGWLSEFTPTIDIHGCSRAFLEWKIRSMLKKVNIEIIDNTEVTGLIYSKGMVRGVDLGAKKLEAELVVDAGGRNSLTPKWLEQIGLSKVKETIVNPYVGYATRIYKRIMGINGKWNALYIQPAPPDNLTGGVILPIEKNMSIVSLVGMGKNYPPVDEKGWLEFSKGIRDPVFYNTIRNAKPVSQIFSYRNITNRVRHYESYKMPQNLIVIGDSVSSFNPVYGQGMTAGSLAAVAVDEWLKKICKDRTMPKNMDSNTFQRKLADINKPLWRMAIIEDFLCKETEGGDRNMQIRMMEFYINNIFYAATKDRKIAKELTEVMNLLRPQSTLLHLNAVFRILKDDLVI